MIYIAMSGFPILLWMQIDAQFCMPIPINAILLAATSGGGSAGEAGSAASLSLRVLEAVFPGTVRGHVYT